MTDGTRRPDWSRMSAAAIARALGVRPTDPAVQRIIVEREMNAALQQERQRQCDDADAGQEAA